MAKSKPIQQKKKADQKQKGSPAKELTDLPGFHKYIAGKEHYVFLILSTLIILFVFKDFIFFKNVYLFKDIGSDTINIFYPQFVQLSEYIKQDGIPKWSFHQGMGQNVFPFSIGDPANLIYAFVGTDNIPCAIIYVEISKILSGGLLFFFYLKTIKISGYSAILGSLLFSFSGYMILGGGWYVFSYEAILVIFLLYSFEKFLMQNKWYLLPIPVALIGSFQPFYLYIYGLFMTLYSIVRYIEEKENDIKKAVGFFLKLGSLCLLGIVMSSVFLCSNVMQMLQSPRVGGESSFFKILSGKPVFGFAEPIEYISIISRLFSSDLLGTGSNFGGWHNYLESPILYCGLFSLLLIPQFFSLFERRKKIIYTFVAGLLILPLLFPYFRYLFWAFTGDYFRGLSLCIIVAILFFAIRSLDYIDNLKKINIKVLFASLLVILILLFLPSHDKYNTLNTSLRSGVLGFLIVYAALIILISIKKYKSAAQIILLLVVCSELIYFSSVTVNKRPFVSAKELKQKTGYNDYTTDALEFLNKSDKDFFRVNKDYNSGMAIHQSMNDAMVQQFNGTICYSSFNQLYYIKFLERMGIIQPGNENQTRWSIGVSTRPLLQTISSVKYTLSKRNENYLPGQGYDSIAAFGDVRVFKNRYYLPLGFTYDAYISNTDFSKLSAFQKDRALLKSFVIDYNEKEKYSEFQSLLLNDTITNFTFDEYSKLVDRLRQNELTIIEHGQNLIKGTIKTTGKKMLFFSIPYDKGWTAKVDEQEIPLKIINIGFMGLLLDKGSHSIELKYSPPYLYQGLVVSVTGISLFLFLLMFNKLKNKNRREIIIN